MPRRPLDGGATPGYTGESKVVPYDAMATEDEEIFVYDRAGRLVGIYTQTEWRAGRGRFE